MVEKQEIYFVGARLTFAKRLEAPGGYLSQREPFPCSPLLASLLVLALYRYLYFVTIPWMLDFAALIKRFLVSSLSLYALYGVE